SLHDALPICLFSVALSVFRPVGILPVRKRVALCCPDFPLSASWRTAIEQVCFFCKFKEFIGEMSYQVFTSPSKHFTILSVYSDRYRQRYAIDIPLSCRQNE